MSGTKAPQAPQRTIFLLYVPGGAMLGLIPSIVLARLEELTETPTSGLFQAFDGVSTGSIVVAGANVPKMDSARITELFCEAGPTFFPPVPGRYGKMLTANIINVLQDQLDPAKYDRLLVNEINSVFNDMLAKLPEEERGRVNAIRDLATQRWLTGSAKKEILKSCEKLASEHTHLRTATNLIGELTFVRRSNSRLSILFKTVALGGMEKVKTHWANNYLFDSERPKQTYRNFLGDMRMGDCPRTLYISAYDTRQNKMVTFSNRKHDFFSPDPQSPSTTSKSNNKLWDAVMASTANPFAFRPHLTEDGVLCADKAPVHTPITSVQDILKHKPADAAVKLVIIGTSKYLSSDLNEDELMKHYINYGVAGNVISGREISELEGYTMSAAHETLRTLLGEENIIEISPRLAPHTYSESQEFPSKDVLDASEENVKKILKRARTHLVEQDDQIRQLAQMLADNLHLLGQMDQAKYDRVSKRIGVKTEAHPLKTGIGKEIPNIYDRVFGDHPLKKLFDKWTRNVWPQQPPQPKLPPPAAPPAPPESPAPPAA
jgi:hypothetical protein